MTNQILRTIDIAKMLRVDPVIIRRWCEQGKGPEFIRTHGGHYRFERKTVERWLESLKTVGLTDAVGQPE